MIFKEVHITAFGKFRNTDLTFENGVNVIYGENGSGKSTLHTYIRSLLFGLEREHGKAAKGDLYSRMTPWNDPAVYGGSFVFENDGNSFLVERTFDAKNKTLTIRNNETGHLLGNTQATIDDLTSGLTESVYDNTISIAQIKAETDGSLSSYLAEHISGISFGASNSLNVNAALDTLTAARKERKSQIDKDAAGKYETLLSEIQAKEDEISNMTIGEDNLDLQMKELEETIRDQQQKQADLEKQIAETEEKVDSHPLKGTSDAYNYQLQIQETYTAYHAAKQDQTYEKAKASGKHKLILGIVFFLLFALLGAGVCFYDYLPFDLGEFPFEKLPFILAFFGIAVFILLLTVISASRCSKKASAIFAANTQMENYLSEQLKKYMGTSEVSESNINKLMKSIDSYGELTDHLNQAKINRSAVMESIIDLQSKLQAMQEDMSICRQNAHEFEQSVKALTALEEQKTSLEDILKNNQRLNEETLAISVAENIISKISNKLHESISPALNARVSEIVDSITGGVYERLYIDEDLTIALRTNGRTVPLESLNRGTIEQVYLALRIASIEILYPNTAMPILLDDTFAYYDDTRLMNTLKWLAENYPGQVLLFTCHKREAAYLSRMNENYNLITLES